MKKITKPSEKEEATYYSDFSGKCFGNLHPPVELKIEFGYGSKYDGSSLRFDLDDDDLESILSHIRTKLCDETLKSLKKHFKNVEKNYDDNIQSRDWESCERISNEIDLAKKLL